MDDILIKLFNKYYIIYFKIHFKEIKNFSFPKVIIFN